jgi:peroxisomal enoyl-CoA hydratase 2
MSARFTSPVIPGDELETQGWISTDEKTGGTRVDFVQKNKTKGGKLSLGGGVALLKGGQSKL